RATVTAPGGREQLDELVSDIASTPLRRDRPLWELWVAEGLAGGRVAFITKIHHCAADGVLAATQLREVLLDDPVASVAIPPAPAWTPEPWPSRRRLLRDAVVDLARAVARVPRVAWRTLAGVRRVWAEKRAGSLTTPAPFSGPDLSFNRSLTPRRRVVT